MEYCPEIAILQSAFQLIDKQTDGRLSELSKVNCVHYVKVIVLTVNEICSGIEYDLDIETRLLWQQKIHCLMFYMLIKKVYYKQKVSSKSTKVPVLSSLDIISQLFPTFGREFYFELIKQCDWMKYFLQCLQSLNKTTSSSVLSDFLSYCQQEPVSHEDNQLMSKLTDGILARCLCVPDRPTELCEHLLKPLNSPSKYITVIHTDDSSGEMMKVSGDSNDDDDDMSESMLGSEKRIGVELFDEFVKHKPDLFNLIFSHYDKQLSMFEETSLDVRTENEETQLVTQLLVWLYLFQVKEDNSCIDWFTNNVFLTENGNQSDGINETEKIYSLNDSLIDQLCCHGDKLILIQTLEKINNYSSTQLFPCRCHIVDGLWVHSTVGLRLLNGIMGKDESSDVHTGMNVDVCIENTEIIVGESWKSDVTLEALLWRIGGKLHHFKDCVQLLLDENYLDFWMTDRLHQVIIQNSSIFNQPCHVLQLSNILTLITKSSSHSREVISNMIKLIETTFTELSFPNKDDVIKQIYVSGEHYISDIIKTDLDERVTHVLNKVTVDLSDQLLDEIMYLCIGDLMYVLKSTLMLCIYNEQQAVTCAKILRVLYKTCQCKHPVNHPDRSLLSYCIDRFISTQKFTAKQQLYFMMFIAEIINNTKTSVQYKASSIISPEEFISTSILTTLSADNVENQSGNISFYLNLLITALQALLTTNQRDVTFKIEPLPLLVVLAQIQHRCLVISPDEELVTSNMEELQESVNPNKTSCCVTMATNLNIREKINEVKDLFVELIDNGYFTVDFSEIDWMLEEIKDLHLMVKLGMCDIVQRWGHYKYSSEHIVTLETYIKDWKTNLSVIVQYVAVGNTYISTILDFMNEHSLNLDVTCDQLCLVLLQILPQCIDLEIDNILYFIEQLILYDTSCNRMLYKIQSTHFLPLIDYTGIKAQLCTSQLLMYVMISLTLTLEEKPWQQRSILQTMLSSYVRYIKLKCEEVTSLDQMISMIYLNEIFHHVCYVTTQLPEDVVDSTMILLLSIQTQYLTCCNDKCTSVLYEDFIKLRNNLDNNMFDVITTIPGHSEHKQMLIKKLKE